MSSTRRSKDILQSTTSGTESLKTVPAEGLNEGLAKQSKHARWSRTDGLALVVLIFLLTQLYLCSRLKSATYDEQYHIANGLAYLRTGDPRLVPEHPPLINLISALPLLVDSHIVLPLGDASWRDVNSLKFSDLLLWRLNPGGPSMVARARVPIILLALLLAVIVYVWSRQLYGSKAALLALTLLAFDPNILAHGCLATNDVGLTCIATLALYAFWRLLRQPSWSRALITGLTLGLAQVSKFSAIYLFPAMALIFLADQYAAQRSAAQRKPLKMARVLAYLGVILLTTFLTIWAVYGFQMGTLRGYTVPARAYLRGLQAFTHMIEGGKSSFLLGSYSQTGWWYYFPVAFAVKTPLATILLLCFSLFYSYRHRTWRRGLSLLIPIAIYLTFCLISPYNIANRHLLPVLPLLFIFAGQAACADWGRKSTWAMGVALGWLVVSSLTTFPHYLAYFNELVGGPSRGYKV
jgi:4-amino-4-deoxy-L-arabinose transferase-like glycosyltransferase